MEFTEYFSSIPNLIYLNNKSRIITYSNFFLIQYSLMINLHINGKGGSIFISTSNINLMISESYFEECTSSSNDGTYYSGGAIFLDCLNSGSIIKKTCSFQCYITGNNHRSQFAALHLTNKINFLEFVSILKCSPNSNIRRGISFSIIYGNQSIKSINSTLNILDTESIFYSLSSNFLNLNYIG